MSEIVAVDFFCGAGGATKGVNNAGIKVIKGFDIDETAKDAYEKNNPKSSFILKDVRKITTEEITDGVDLKKNKLLFIACAPCQPFSLINKTNKQKKQDRRKSLILAFSKIVTEIKPDYLFVENVPQFCNKNNFYFKSFLNSLKKEKYFVDYDIIDAKYYGVPQTRKRFVLLGSRDKLIKIPGKIFGTNTKKCLTVRDAISRFPPIKAGESHKIVPNHKARSLSIKNLERIKHTTIDGGSRQDWPKHLVLPCHKKHGGHTDVYGRMSWDKPSPTLTCKCNSISNGRFGHPVQNRGISLREAAALQTFEDNYIFYGNATNISKHIGNAVPVLLAETFAKVIKQHHKKQAGSND